MLLDFVLLWFGLPLHKVLLCMYFVQFSFDRCLCAWCCCPLGMHMCGALVLNCVGVKVLGVCLVLKWSPQPPKGLQFISPSPFERCVCVCAWCWSPCSVKVCAVSVSHLCSCEGYLCWSWCCFDFTPTIQRHCSVLDVFSALGQCEVF